jgi:hypothetical protein
VIKPEKRCYAFAEYDKVNLAIDSRVEISSGAQYASLRHSCSRLHCDTSLETYTSQQDEILLQNRGSLHDFVMDIKSGRLENASLIGQDLWMICAYCS